jgi:fucose permease
LPVGIDPIRGLSFLETSTNPFITVLKHGANAERRLNLARAFNPLASITEVAVRRFFILSAPKATRDAYLLPKRRRS